MSRWYIPTASRQTSAHHMSGVCSEMLHDLCGNKHTNVVREWFDKHIEPSSKQWLKFEDNLGLFLIEVITGYPDYELLDDFDTNQIEKFKRAVYYCSGYWSASLHALNQHV